MRVAWPYSDFWQPNSGHRQLRSSFGAAGHAVIVISPKAGYKFNPDFLAVPAFEEVSQANVINLMMRTAPVKSEEKNKVSKKVVGKAMLAVGSAFFIVGIVYSVIEIEIMEKVPLKISRAHQHKPADGTISHRSSSGLAS